MKTQEIISLIIFIFFVGVYIGMLLMGILIKFASGPIQLNQETANEICFNITNVSGVEARFSNDGKLICKLPSFDSTQNIVIEGSGSK